MKRETADYLHRIKESDDLNARLQKLTDQIVRAIDALRDKPVKVMVNGEYLTHLAKNGPEPLPEVNATPQAAVIEILEYTDADPLIVVPNGVRINGQRVLTSADHPITIHEFPPERGGVMVTLTLFAKRVTIGAEPKSG